MNKIARNLLKVIKWHLEDLCLNYITRLWIMLHAYEVGSNVSYLSAMQVLNTMLTYNIKNVIALHCTYTFTACLYFSYIETNYNKSKEDKVQVANFKNSPKFQTLQTLHMTHLLKLLDKMCKYEMDPTNIVEDTERTRFCPQTDRRTDGQTDKVKPVYPPFNFVEAEGITR